MGISHQIIEKKDIVKAFFQDKGEILAKQTCSNLTSYQQQEQDFSDKSMEHSKCLYWHTKTTATFLLRENPKYRGSSSCFPKPN
jgi:hypothetical protein